MARRSGRRRAEPEKEVNNERWLITYSDLITLLLIFFIVMYTMSKIDANKFEAVANSLAQVLQGKSVSIMQTPGPSVVNGRSGNIIREGPGKTPAKQGDLESVEKQLNEYIKQNKDLAQNVIVYEQERGLVISFKDAILFPSGSDQILPAAQDILLKVAASLRDIPNYIRVEGHTDSRPIHTQRFPSNWELSVLRATNVVHLLVERGGIEPDRISATGYGEYRPLVPNRSEKEMAMNRRVDIVILKDKYGYFEPTSKNE